MGRHEAGVEGDGGANRLQEDVDGDLGHGRYFSGVLEARGVSVWAEDGDDLVAGRAEGLEALVGLLAVVEGRRHAVDAHEGVGHEAERRPFARRFGVRGFDVAIDCDGVSIQYQRKHVALAMGGRGKHWEPGRSRQRLWGGALASHRTFNSPSRTLKPTLLQSMVFTGGGGKAPGIVTR